jgi:hypothetical protein
MNLQPIKVYSDPPWRVICSKCSRWEDENKCYADLDGEAFKAFYCKACHDDIVNLGESK